jgi:putative oxidoreductase
MSTSFSEFLSPLIGRCLLGWLFLAEVVHYGGNWKDTVYLMTIAHTPAAAGVLFLALVVVILGSLSLILGFHTRHGAMLLFSVTVIAAVSMHAYWVIHDEILRQSVFQLFVRDIAVAGGLLVLVGAGSGPIAIDNRLAGKKSG